MTDTTALREEGGLLAAVVGDAGDRLREVGPFAGWTGRDTLTVLAFVDRMAQLVLTDRATYERELAEFGAATAGGRPDEIHDRMVAFARSKYDAGDWWPGFGALCNELEGHDPDEQVPWFGRSLTVERLTAARQMEVFAYGQDVTDLLRTSRPATDRLRSVADFAVRALRFSFANRDLPAPDERPAVELLAPSGARWSWGDDPINLVSGPAEDFCLVATQRRHLDDTALHVRGPVATRWMAIAQCIAGPPLPGPAPGQRARAR